MKLHLRSYGINETQTCLADWSLIVRGSVYRLKCLLMVMWITFSSWFIDCNLYLIPGNFKRASLSARVGHILSIFAATLTCLYQYLYVSSGCQVSWSCFSCKQAYQYLCDSLWFLKFFFREKKKNKHKCRIFIMSWQLGHFTIYSDW